MRDVQKEIQENLNAIEEQYRVRILLAIESGSRAWGFASPDSDFDVRFIYTYKTEEYIRIDDLPDVIEWKLDEVLDINGWDLKKALYAFAKGNPNMIEWANSPIVYRQSDDWQGLWTTASHYFSQKAGLCHYYGTANSTYQKYLKDDEIKYKKYFYALRPLLCCRWIERFHQAPPVEFNNLLVLFDGNDEILNDALKDSIDDLLIRKASTNEKDLNPQTPVIINFIRDECARQKELSDIFPDDHNRDYTEINRAFRRVLGFPDKS